jgi:micrococcal nuclease
MARNDDERLYWYRCVLKRVIDGDTVVVDVDLGFEVWQLGRVVRLAEVYAPELRSPGGAAAKQFTERLLAGGQLLLHSRRKDKYGRALGYLEVAGQDVSTQIRAFVEGLANGPALRA